MSLAVRSQMQEQMDADDLSPEIYAAVIGDLARVNRLTLAARPTLSFIRRATNGQAFRLLDVGFGHGDMLRTIARWARKRGRECELVGVDLNPRSEPAARDATPPTLPIRYVTGDYADLAHEPWDLIVSSLVAHHMSHAELIAFTRFMDAHARMGWLVNDLHRHRLAHAGFPVLATLMRWHPMVKADGTLSIARSYRPGEWDPILAEAGITARVYRAFPFRLCVERIR
ncbi:methyltransferase domain-containing protein [Sphingomonas sp. ID1715]|uniref:methyltransferase domain-containing protein n=1 Tax=Sphingomonas sp. ID1715 TaxID=1656898 RepID=UPI001488E526|nr:methyltransferase domain-containing protein [Sphingomonas sp. ID1715]NNM77268.1 methyltransferase domain-containing protein [Sphingomonas sp. ID1715]